MLTRLRRRLAADRGFTLVEVLLGMSIGTIVLFGLFTLFVQVSPASKRITDRTEAQQRARLAMVNVMRPFRSAVCAPAASGAIQGPILSASGTQLTFFSFVPTATQVNANPPVFAPKIKQLLYAAATSTLTLKTWNDPAVDPTTATPDATQILLTNVTPSGGASADATAVFGYFRPDDSTALAAGSITANLASINRLRVGITVGPLKSTTYTDGNTTLNEDATLDLAPKYVNGVAQGGPQCLI